MKPCVLRYAQATLLNKPDALLLLLAIHLHLEVPSQCTQPSESFIFGMEPLNPLTQGDLSNRVMDAVNGLERLWARPGVVAAFSLLLLSEGRRTGEG